MRRFNDTPGGSAVQRMALSTLGTLLALAGFVIPCTIAMAQDSMGLLKEADATWTLRPKHEWDVAAGVALVEAVGGRVVDKFGEPLRFNQRRPRFHSVVATSAATTGWFAPR